MSSESIRNRNPYFERVDEDPEYEVRKVLAQINWDGSIPVNLIEVCDMYGFDVQFSPMPDMKEIGTTKFFGDGDFCIIINTHNTSCLDGFSDNQSEARRQRFTLAHEIGHCVYKSHTDIGLQKNLQTPSNPHSRNYVRQREEQANLFAAYLLIPREAFKKLLRNVDWLNVSGLVQKVSENFDVSVQVAAQQIARLADFPCITILFKEDGNPLRTPTYSPEFSETGLFYGKHQPLPEGTLAFQMLNGKSSKQCDKRRYRDASTWFPNTAEWKAEKFSVTETSIRTGQYGIASFLEIEELDN